MTAAIVTFPFVASNIPCSIFQPRSDEATLPSFRRDLTTHGSEHATPSLMWSVNSTLNSQLRPDEAPLPLRTECLCGTPFQGLFLAVLGGIQRQMSLNVPPGAYTFNQGMFDKTCITSQGQAQRSVIQATPIHYLLPSPLGGWSV